MNIEIGNDYELVKRGDIIEANDESFGPDQCWEKLSEKYVGGAITSTLVRRKKKIDPGEGYRLIDQKVDKFQNTDDVLTCRGVWERTGNFENYSSGKTYRRKVEQFVILYLPGYKIYATKAEAKAACSADHAVVKVV